MPANGEVPESGRINMQSECLPKGFGTTVLEETPNRLSLGKLVGQEGYSFQWSSRKPPYLKAPDGTVFALDVIDMVPLGP